MTTTWSFRRGLPRFVIICALATLLVPCWAGVSLGSTPLTTFTDPGGTPGDYFGYSVAAVGNNVLIGAYNSNNSRGAAYLFDQSGSLLTTFTDPGGVQQDRFGYSVAAIGNNVLIGARGSNYCGAVYLYDQSGSLLRTFTDPRVAGTNEFGCCVAAVGNNVLIGAYGENSLRGAATFLTRAAACCIHLPIPGVLPMIATAVL